MTMTFPRFVAIVIDVLDPAEAITERIEIFWGSLDTRFPDEVRMIHPSFVNASGSRTWLVRWVMQLVVEESAPKVAAELHW